MDNTKGNIGIKEFIAIIILTMGIKLSDDTPGILYEKMENAAWMAPIINGIILCIPIFLLTKLITLYGDKNLIDIIMHLFGKYIGFFIVFILWVFQTYALILDSGIYVDIIGTMYFSKTPDLIIYIILMAVATYGAKKGIESIGSFARFILTGVKISVFIVLVTLWIRGEFGFIYPIFGPGQLEVVKESVTYLSIFADLLFLGIIASQIKSASVFKKGIWIGFIIVVFELVIALVGYVMLFDYTGVKLINYPYHETIRYIQFGFLTNVESLFFPFWLLASLVRFAYYLYLSVFMFGALFKIQQFEYVAAPLATLVVFIGMTPETPNIAILNLRANFLKLVTPIIFLLPLLLWLTAKLKGEFKK